MAGLASLVELISICPPPFIYVQTPLGSLPTPASHLATSFQNHPSVAVVRLDAIECFSARSLFTTIVNSLVQWECSWDLKLGSGGECWEGASGEKWDTTWDHFAAALREAYADRIAQEKEKASTKYSEEYRVALVFDNAERLKTNIPTLMVPLVRIRELTNLPLTIILVSSMGWEDTSPSSSSCPEPFTIHIEHTSKSDFITQLTSTFPSATHDTSPEPAIHPYNPILKPLYGRFLDILYKSCSNYTNKPAEIAYIASAMWPGFIRPLLEDWNAEKDAWDTADADYHPSLTTLPDDGAEVLVSRFLKAFPQAFNSLYSRSVSARSFIRSQQSQPCFRLSQPFAQTKLTDLSSIKPIMSHESSRTTFPIQAKMLLVASYVASFNPSKTDLRMFGRTSDGPMRKRRPGPRRAKAGTIAKVPQKLAGPSPFSLERLMAIYAALLTEHGPESDGPLPAEGEVEVEVNRSQVLMAVAELAQRRLIQRTSQGEKLDNSIVFKCNISLDTAEGLAKEFRVNLNELLWDPPE